MSRILIFVFALLTVSLHGAVILELPFDRETPEVKGKAVVVPVNDGGKALRIDSEKSNVASIFLPADQLSGRRVIISCELKRDIPEVFTRYQGGKLMLVYQESDGTDKYATQYLPPGSFDWQNFKLTADLPLIVKSPRIVLGIQSGKGTIFYRNLKCETGDVIVNLSEVANMGLVDAKARDGKGGWTDEGKFNDAANFQFKKLEFGGIPFRMTDPGKNNGKAVITFQGAKFPGGVKETSLDLRPGKVSGKWLYLLHTITQCTAGTVFGDLEVSGKSGKKVSFELMSDRDAANWWNPIRQTNAMPASIWASGSSQVGVYVSRFPLPENFGELAEIRLLSRNSQATWVVCGITVSEREYSLADAGDKAVLIKAGERWRILPIPKEAGIRPDSALDLRTVFPHNGSVDELGRVLVDDAGRFYYENHPGKQVRFLSGSQSTDFFWGRSLYKVPPEYDSRERMELHADELLKRGYNMVRFHFVDAVLMNGQKNDFEFDQERLEQFDLITHLLRQRGIYYQLDVMSSRISFAHGKVWTHDPKIDKRDFKLEIFFKNEVRRIWVDGMKKLFHHRNPHTGLRLIDDPALVMVVCCNEQEFAFGGKGDYSIAQPRFREFLIRRYNSTEALSKAWKTTVNSFDEVSFSGEEIGRNSPKGKDIARFIAEVEQEIFDFYYKELRAAGFKGLIGSWNMGKSLHYMSVRDSHDYVAMNSYHAHPFGNIIDPGSSVGSSARLMRNFATTRRYGKPYSVTEHLHCFWNPYRYEGGMITGGYAALQDFNVLSAYAHVVSTYPEPRLMVPFSVRYDPIAAASEFQNALLFRRGDVAPAKQHFRLFFDREPLYDSGSSGDTIDTEQSMLALVGTVSSEVGKPKKILPNEIALPAYGGSRVSFVAVGQSGGYAQSEDTGKSSVFNFDQEISILKKKKFLPADNRSSFKEGRFESATGELMLEQKRNFLSVDTPRFRGFAGEAGTKASMTGFSAELGGTRGGLTVASVDQAKSLEESNRIVVVFSTNVLNSGMRFEDETHRVRIAAGQLPWLIETGSFRLTLANRNAANIKAYALGLDGARIAELPLQKKAEELTLEVDTAKIPNGPVIYFELVSKNM